MSVLVVGGDGSGGGHIEVASTLIGSGGLDVGSQGHTAEAEQELLELWSGVEKDKAALVNRFKQRQRQPSAGRLAMVPASGNPRLLAWPRDTFFV